MKTEKCLLCDKKSNLIFLQEYTDNKIKYELYECSDCRGQFWVPFKNPGSEWYEKDVRYAEANKNPPLDPNWNHRKIISFLAPFAGKVLDVGCGTGNFLAHAKKKGWNVFGFDFDRNAIQCSKTIFQLPNTEVASLEEFHKKYIDNGGEGFDLITFFDLFEHIDNHFEFLNKIKDLLDNNGYIAMSMPYRHGSSWLQPNDLPPRHLTRWSRSSLTHYLENNGFKVIYIKRSPTSIFGIIMKLRFKYGKFISFGWVKKNQMKTGKEKNINMPANKSFRLGFIHLIAKVKDIIIFGVPAFIIWICFLFTKKRYTGLFAIAQKTTV